MGFKNNVIGRAVLRRLIRRSTGVRLESLNSPLAGPGCSPPNIYGGDRAGGGANCAVLMGRTKPAGATQLTPEAAHQRQSMASLGSIQPVMKGYSEKHRRNPYTRNQP